MSARLLAYPAPNRSTSWKIWAYVNRYFRLVCLVLFIVLSFARVNVLYELIIAISPSGELAKQIMSMELGKAIEVYKNSSDTIALQKSNPYLAKSRNDSLNLALQYRGMRCADMAEKSEVRGGYRPNTDAKKLDYFQAAGGVDNNCADFVNALLYNTGRLTPVNTCADYRVKCLNNRLKTMPGKWRRISKSEAQPGDLWMIIRANGTGHVMMVVDASRNQYIGCNNNVRYNVQYVTVMTNNQNAIFWTDRPV